MSGELILTILHRLIDHGTEVLRPEIAKALLDLRFPSADESRINVLGDKSNSGTLTADEAAEYDGYIAVADLLSLWQSKARRSLQQNSAAAVA